MENVCFGDSISKGDVIIVTFNYAIHAADM